jgi:hypothetical protein
MRRVAAVGCEAAAGSELMIVSMIELRKDFVVAALIVAEQQC